MPPQQRNRLLDLLVERFCLGGHATVTPSFGVNLNGAEYRQAARLSSLGKKTEPVKSASTQETKNSGVSSVRQKKGCLQEYLGRNPRKKPYPLALQVGLTSEENAIRKEASLCPSKPHGKEALTIFLLICDRFIPPNRENTDCGRQEKSPKIRTTSLRGSTSLRGY